MAQVKVDISMSLDGFVTGPDPGVSEPLGVDGERLHDWVTRVRSWREAHGMEGGETGVDSDVLAEAIEGVGATVMGRKMFLGPPDEGPWGDDPGIGVWGDEPPFRMPVFVLTHYPREPLSMENGTSYTFVTDGIESAVSQALEAAGGKHVSIAGGADVIQQALRAGLVDELQIHVAPLLLGGGVRLFEGVGGVKVEPTRVIGSPAVTHVKYRVVK
jgi:dihydrofolate reductase